ncbi:hypothetical protein ABT160_42360 [Streptomyces sp. NPDC001941]|uniref:hypothetical protein n=1 Tax=Streptomyces sp. NPDC001941 TaxID=3154659 RepID=UPI00332798AD
MVVEQDGVQDAVARARLEVRTGAAWASWEVAAAAWEGLTAPVAASGVARRERGRIQAGLDERVLPVVWACIAPGERPGYPVALDAFLERHDQRLKRLFAQHRPTAADAVAGRFAVLGSPVALLVLERQAGTGSRFGLAARWKDEGLDEQWLKDAATAWEAARS